MDKIAVLIPCYNEEKTIEKVVTDYDTIIFTPVKITPTDCFSTDGRSYTFTRNVE